MSVLAIQHLALTLSAADKPPVPLVEDVSFSLQESRMLALVGESGCGKSITAAAIGGLLPPGIQQTAGRIAWADGAPVQRGRGIAYVFQDPGECLNPVFTIASQIKEVLPPEERPQAALIMERLLRRVGFEEPARVLSSYPHQLSGGQQQRAMLAMALATHPRVLIADEPTTALDVTVQAKILRLLADLQRTEKLAVLLITHNLGVVAEVADDMAVMYAGRIVESGSVRALLTHPQHPYLRALLRALPRLAPGEAIPALEGIPGIVPPPGQRGEGCAFAPRCPHAQPPCRSERPPLRTTAAGHPAACHTAAQ